MKLTTFLISKTRRIFTKLLAVSESAIKIKARSHGTISIILLTSAVIFKQNYYFKLNGIVQHFQNCKCYNVAQGYFRKPL